MKLELSPELIPADFRPGATAAASAISSLDKVLIAAHVRPDGDAIGSMLACGWILKSLERSFVLYLPDGMPEYLQFLELPGPVCASLDTLPFEPEAAIYVDCSECSRLGRELEARCAAWPSVNMDHHICERGLGTLANFISQEAAAASQLVAYVADALDIPLAGNLGRALGAGLLTDTGYFNHDNTSSAIFLLCAQLEQQGIHLPAIGAQLRSGWSLNRLRLWGYLFMQVGQALGDRVAWSVITLGDLRDYGCKAEELEGYIDSLSRLKCVEIAFTLREALEKDENGRPRTITRLSMRSRGNVSVREITQQFGGGGHKNAAGATIRTYPWQALPEVLNAIDRYLDENGM